MKSSLGRAMEAADILRDDDFENSVSLASEEIKARFDALKTRRSAIEDLNSYAKLIDGLLVNGAYNTKTLNSICAEAITFAKELTGDSFHLPTLESNSDEALRRQHALVVEGINEKLNNLVNDYFQLALMEIKNFVYTIVDVFRSLESRVENYHELITETRVIYENRRNRFKPGDHHLSLVELWFFFSDNEGPCKDVLTSLKRDVEASKYIVGKYVDDVLKESKKLEGVISSISIRNTNDAERFLEKFKSFRHPVTLFDDSHLGQGILLNSTSVYKLLRKSGKPKQFAGKTYDYISELANKSTVETSTAVKHVGDKFMYNFSAWAAQTAMDMSGLPYAIAYMGGMALGAPGAIFGALLSKSVGTAVKAITHSIVFKDVPPMTVTSSEIGEIIEYGEEYSKISKDFLAKKGRIVSEAENIARVIESISKSPDRIQLEGKEAKEFSDLLRQISGYAENLVFALQKPALDEVKRISRGTRYTAHLAKRLIWNAT